MSLVAPYKVSLNPANTAVILTDDNNVTKILQRGAFIPYQIGTDTVGLTFIINGRSESITAPFADWQNALAVPLGGNQYDTLVALSNLMGFNLGGVVGGVTSVNGDVGIVTVDLDSVLAQGTAEPDGNYGLNFVGGVATLVPINGETVGSYKAFATTTIPTNYLWCNGASVLVATYPDLFAIIGYTFGGSGANFTLPNLTDRFLKGDDGANIGTLTGQNTLLTSQLPQHRHSLLVNSDLADSISATGNFLSSQDGSGSGLMNSSGGSLEIASASSIGLSGSGLPHEHPNIAVRWAICFESVGVSGASPTPSFNAVLGVDNDSPIRAMFNGVNYATVNDIIAATTLQAVTDNGNIVTYEPDLLNFIEFVRYQHASEDSFIRIGLNEVGDSVIEFWKNSNLVGFWTTEIDGAIKTNVGNFKKLIVENLNNSGQYVELNSIATVVRTQILQDKSGTIALNNPNIIEVFSLADLPTPVANIITLANNKTYQFSGLVNIGTNQIQVGASNTIVGVDKSDDGIVYTGTGAAILCTNQSLSVVNILISSPSGTAFSVTNTTTFSFQIRECIFASGGFGTVNGGNIIAITNNIFSATMSNGATVQGTCNKLAFSNNFHEGLVVAGILINIPSGSFKNIEILSSNFTVNASVVGINIGSVSYTSMTNEAGLILGNIFDGAGTYATGISTESDNNWFVIGNTGIISTVTRGKLFITANATNTTIVSTATYVKMAGTTTSANLSRVTMPVSNRLQYTGARATSLRLTAVGSITSASNNQTLRVVFYKNGVIIPESEQEIRVSTANESTQFSLIGYASSVTNDFYEIFVRNTSSTATVRVEYLTFII